MDELHGEFPSPDRLARLHRHQLGALEKAVLLQLQLDKPRSETGAVDGQVDLLEDIGDGAHVILVAVGDEKPSDPGTVFDEVADVGDDAVDAVHVVPGERHAAVHHDDLPAALVGGHVLADLVETAQGDDFQFFCHKNRNSFFFKTVWTAPPIRCGAAPSAEKCARKDETPVACTAPFRRQGFGCVMSESDMRAVIYLTGETLPLAGKIHKERHRTRMVRGAMRRCRR